MEGIDICEFAVRSNAPREDVVEFAEVIGIELRQCEAGIIAPVSYTPLPLPTKSLV